MARSETDRSAQEIMPPTCDDQLMWDMFTFPMIYPTMTVADELGVFACIAEMKAGATVTQLADKLSISPRAAEALLGVLASAGFLRQHGGRFLLTDPARNFLLPESPFYWGGMLHLHRHSGLTHDTLKQALLTDKPGVEMGTNFWEGEAADKAMIEYTTQSMHAHSFPSAMGVAIHGDFAGVKRVLDVGGGSGCFCIALGFRHPEMRFTVLELPLVCPLIDSYAAKYGLGDRITALSGNMFEDDWPAGHDAHFFSNIFHDWNDDQCRKLAAKSFAALPRGGRIVLHEVLLNDTKDGPPVGALFSMMMVHYTRGKQRSLPEFVALLTAEGFTDVRATPTYGVYSVVTGRKG